MPESQSRRLAAILAADIAGYSALMGADEARTVRDLKGHQAVVLPMVSEFDGRIIDTAGDGILAEFASVLNALNCAVAIQSKMAQRNAEIEPEWRMQFRIGINIGDVLCDETRIYGDGINVAARLESIAEPGGICISSKVYEEIRGRIDLAYHDMGEQRLKNIARPVKVYRVHVDSVPARPTLALPDKPSIAVLPFTNMSGDPEQEYFADGITEDIITELSRFSELFVIARNSSFQYKGKAIDLRQVGRELGVRYVLEGSIRRSDNRVRITAQLIDAGTSAHRWAERYDRELKDVFAIQDEVARTIATILAAHVKSAEAERTLLKPPATWQAYDHYMRAAAAWVSFLSSWKIEDLSETRRYLSGSLSVDPKYARAYALLASTHRVAWLNPLNEEYMNSPALDQAIQLARKAIELDPKLPDAYAELGYTIIRKREFDAATAAAERAIALNPNFADYRLALVFIFVGEIARGIEVAQACMRLDPFHPHFAPLMLGEAHYLLKQYREAQNWLREATGRSPNHQFGHAWLAATYAQLGQMEDAHREVAEVLRINPKYSINGVHRRVFVIRHSEDMEHAVDGLRKAGLPE